MRLTVSTIFQRKLCGFLNGSDITMKVDTLNFDLTVVNAAAEVGKREETTTAVASVSPPPPPLQNGEINYWFSFMSMVRH